MSAFITIPSKRICMGVKSDARLRHVSALSNTTSSSHAPRCQYHNNSYNPHRYRASATISSNRYFSNPSSFESEYEGLIAKRNKNIRMNPDGIGQQILPGNFVIKKNPKTGAEKKVILEHALGFFWAFKDLTLTDKKPILSNETIIPAAEAETFPELKELVNLHEKVVDLPEFFTRHNRSKDASAQCTLVAISCKDFGAKLLPSWTEPFETTFHDGSSDAERYEVVRITINEGRIVKLLSPFIVSGTKKNVDPADHENTLLFYGDAEEFRDILRMHNIYTSYVFLLDGIGRIRWVGSGEGSEDETQSMIEVAKMLTKPPERVRQKQSSSGPRTSKKVRNDRK